MPSIVGFVAMQYARRRSLPGGLVEAIKIVAFDVDGQAWGLVERMTPIEEPPGSPRSPLSGRMARLDYHRWVRFDAVPFVTDEVVKAGRDGWPVSVSE